MIRNLLATTAIATLLTSGAVAQTTAPASDPAMGAPAEAGQQTEMVIRAEGHLASNLIGESVYNGTGEDAENIGEVKDLVIGNEGDVQAIVVGVGGFLGIGQKEVALEYDLVQWADQQDGERWLVVETTKDALEAQEDFDAAAYRPMPADADVAETRPATAEDLAAAPAAEEGQEGSTDTMGDTAAAPADEEPEEAMGDTAAAPADEQAEGTDTMAAAPAEGGEAAGDDAGGETTVIVEEQDSATEETEVATDTEVEVDQAAEGEATVAEDRQDRPADQTAASNEQAAGTDETQTAAIDRNSLQQAQPDQISAENLTGTTVYGANEEDIGEIGDVILTPEGEIDAIIVDVGGFLGIGEKQVAVGMDNLAFMTDEDGELYLYTEFTQEELEAQPEYDETTYAEQRNEMRMQVQ